MAKLTGINWIFLPLPTGTYVAAAEPVLRHRSGRRPRRRASRERRCGLSSCAQYMVSSIPVNLSVFLRCRCSDAHCSETSAPQATIAPLPPSQFWPSPPSAAADIGADKLLRQRTWSFWPNQIQDYHEVNLSITSSVQHWKASGWVLKTCQCVWQTGMHPHSHLCVYSRVPKI